MQCGSQCIQSLRVAPLPERLHGFRDLGGLIEPALAGMDLGRCPSEPIREIYRFEWKRPYG